MKRSIENYKKCCPESMSRMSEAAIYFALQDMKTDILTLHNALFELYKQANLEMPNNSATEYALIALTSNS